MRHLTNQISDCGLSRQMVRGQRGAALLLLLLMLVIASTYIMVTRLQVNASAAERAQHDALVLAQARDALIGYAAKDSNRPGELPCPDFNNDGQILITDDYSGSNCKTLVGWLPWKTLGLPDLHDSSGERLWYALSDDFHANSSATLNSATLGQITVSGTINMNNIVAIVIAPGAVVGSQTRPSADATGLANYLEGSNATASPNTNYQANLASDTFNDVLLPITHDRLFSVIDKRVLKEISSSLETYRSDPDHDASTTVTAYPWLSPYMNPLSATFKGVIGTHEGLLPIHITDETFTSSFAVTWDITDGSASVSGDVPQECVEHGSCDWTPGAPITAPPVTAGTCVWTTKDEVDCSGVATTTPDSGVTTLTYTYSVMCRNSGSGNNACTGTSVIKNPSASALRTRDWSATGTIKATISIVAKDGAGTTLGNGSLQVDGITTGTINVKNIQYDLDTNTKELPAWVVSQDWDQLIYVAYASLESLPGSTPPCTAGTDCLTVENDTLPNDNKRALIVLSGPALAGQNRSVAGGSLSDYFEGENATPTDRKFEKQTESAMFNDKIEVISTSP